VGAVAERPAVLAAVVVAAQAGPAGGAGDVEAAKHAVTGSDPLHAGPDFKDGADELVTNREAGLDRHPPVVDVEVGPAYPARLDTHHRLVGGAELGVGLLFEPHLARRLKRDRAH